MRISAIGLAIPALCAFTVSGQTQQTFNFTHAATVQDFQEAVTLIRTVAGIKQTSTDNAQKSMTVNGTEDQLALAGWLFKELDKAPATADSAPLEYNAGSDDVVRVFYLNHTDTVQDFQEIANLVRVATGTKTAFTYNTPRALALRGTGDQMALADWLVNELNHAPNDKAEHTYQAPGGGANVVRIFYLPGTKTVQDFQEVANLTRTMTEIKTAFTYNAHRALAFRGTADEIAFADWLLHQLNSNGQDEYRVPNASDDVARVFYLTKTPTPQAFQQEAQEIRKATSIRRAFTYNAERALALRGTVTQIALAEQMVKDFDSPKQ
jgi:hypothetical protein